MAVTGLGLVDGCHLVQLVEMESSAAHSELNLGHCAAAAIFFLS
jgi:hypothetical protein